MSALNESTVEDAALLMPSAPITPAFPHGEKENRDAIRRLNPASPQSCSLVALLPKLLSGELSVALATSLT